MPRSFLRLLALSLASSGMAQVSTPSAPTIQARTNLVVVDVVVTDRAGHNVHGLQPSDFAITEKGRPQQIRSFDEHSAPAQPIRPEPVAPLPPGTFTNYTPAVASAALNVVLLDTLNTPLKDQSYLRLQLLKYLRSAPSGSPVAIFGLTTHLILLQGFTSDPRLLQAAIDRKSIRPSHLLDDPTTGGPAEELSDIVSSSASGPQGALAATVANLRQFEAEQGSFQTQLRARYTLAGMNQLARFLATFPGRKNLVWFSGSFPLSVMPDGDLPDPFPAVADMSDEFRDTANLLTRSQVAVYPVDARGLFNAPMFDASQRGSSFFSDPGSFGRDLQRFNQQTALEHATMRQMADQTGGRAFLNSNGLKEALETVISTGANFYTITYSPTDTHWDGAFRKIGLELQGRFAGQKLNLAYRRGYFAVDPDPTPRTRRALNANGVPITVPASPNAMLAAMARGGPASSEVIFKARVLPATLPSAPPENAPDPSTQPSPNPKLAHGPWRRYLIDIAAIPGQLLVSRSPDGGLSGAAELVIHCYDVSGALVSATSNGARISLSAQDLRRLSGTGLQFHQVISVPAKGDYFLRIGVHDLIRDHVGALEIPLSSIKNLPPPPSPASPTHTYAPAIPSPQFYPDMQGETQSRETGHLQSALPLTPPR